MEDAIRKLESTVLELGTEVYVLRNQLTKASSRNEQMLKIIQSLQKLLDEKNLISTEDFEIAIKLEDISQSEGGAMEDLRLQDADSKKYSH
jgi:hypothetical protein